MKRVQLETRRRRAWRVPRLARKIGLWLALACGFQNSAEIIHAAENRGAQVIVIANRADPDSLRIARHYASARAVPVENIIAFDMPTRETIGWREFVATVWQPVRDELVSRKWIDAFGGSVPDDVGRKKYAVNGHRITALVVCRGVPLRIMHEPQFYTEHPPYTARTDFRSNAGAVDSELSLLAHSQHNINAFVTNPGFHVEIPTGQDRGSVIPVGRLDGPTADDAITLVDRAIEVEKTGLIGRAYVDIGGIYPAGDVWFEAVTTQLANLGFDTTVDRSSRTLAATARFDEPVLYFGWYATDLNGPFALPGFRFPPGAVAFHIHSFSAGSMRSTTSGWTAPFVARGVTATVGNVYEPYLSLTHRPDYLLHALAGGATLGEAALYALPALSWQSILVGDPLYRPFAISFEEQWRNRAQLPARLASYVVLRQVSLWEKSGMAADALALLRSTQEATPSLPIGLALAHRLLASGDSAGAAQALKFAGGLKNFRADEWALARLAAQVLAANSEARAAVEIYRLLFATASLPRALRVAWLEEAAAIALTAGDRVLSEGWKTQRAEILSPATGTKK